MGEDVLDVLIDNHLDYLIKNECVKVKRGQTKTDDDDDDQRRRSLGNIIISISIILCTTMVITHVHMQRLLKRCLDNVRISTVSLSQMTTKV